MSRLRTLRRSRRRAAAAGLALAALAPLATPAPSRARPFTLDDLLSQQAFGAVTLDPHSRRAIIEESDAFASADRFDYDQVESIARTRLYRVDFPAKAADGPSGGPAPPPGPLRPLFPDPSLRGVTVAAVSPSGDRLAVSRLQGDRYTLGVVRLATGAVRWQPITPERSLFGRSVQWLSEDQLLVIARPDRSPSFSLRQGRASADALPGLWARQAAGQTAVAVAGSGRYAADRPRPPPRQLLRLDLATGAAQVLATGELNDLELSPDRRHLALLETGEDLQPRADGPAQGAIGVQTQAQRLSILDLKTGQRRSVDPGWDILPTLISWSPDGRRLLVFARRNAPSPWRAGQFLTVDAATSRPTVVSGGLTPWLSFRPELVAAGWLGDRPVALAAPIAAPAPARAASPNAATDAMRPASPLNGPTYGPTPARLDWYRLDPRQPRRLSAALSAPGAEVVAASPTALTVLDGDGRPWRLTAQGVATRLGETPMGLARPPLPGAGRAAHGWPAAALVRMSGGGQAGDDLAWLDAAGLHHLGHAAPGTEVLAATAPDAGERPWAILSARAPTGVETLAALPPGRAPIPLAVANAGLADLDEVTAVRIAHKGADGAPLTSWLLLPPRAPGAPPPPLVAIVYKGAVYPRPTFGSARVETFVVDPRMLLGHGFAVLEPSLPRAPGDHDPMRGIADGVLAAVDAIAARPDLAGQVDTARLALWGHSFGGYAVMAALEQSDRFAAGVAIAGVADPLLSWVNAPAAHRPHPEEGWWGNWSTGNTEDGQTDLGGPPWTFPQRYRDNSPLLHADRIKTPLLLAHGDQDMIPLAGSEAMFSALYRQDKDAILLTYFGELHFLSSPGNLRDFYARAFAFLDAHLRAAATPPSDAPRPRSPPPRGAPSPRRSR